MTLIKSISGIRGTIGGGAGEGLNPLDIVKFTSAYATLIRKTCTVKSNKIVVGRDARISGEMVKNVVVGTLMGMGWDVVDIDLASTPTTELAVTMEGASGGIILTASHNPKQWNALKLLNEKGEFLNAAEGQEVLRIAAAEEFDYAEVDQLGSYRQDLSYNQKHIDSVLALDLVDVEAIRKANFRVAIDCVNSVGGIILPQLLEQLGVQHVEKLYCEPTGNFQHNPEPLEKNLGDIMGLMKKGTCDVAFVVTATACAVVVFGFVVLEILLAVLVCVRLSVLPGTIFIALFCISFRSIVIVLMYPFPFSVCAGIFSPNSSYASAYFVSGRADLTTTRIILKSDGGSFTVTFLE